MWCCVFSMYTILYMQKVQKNARIQRVHALCDILTTLYPNPKSMLIYSTAWELLVATILSAQCTDERVNSVTKNLFKIYPTIDSYCTASQKEIEGVIYSCGFYRKKATYIRTAAYTIFTRFGGNVPHTMKELSSISGVGRKTANIVLSNVFQIYEGIAVDTHVRRFALRFDLTDYTDPFYIEKDLQEIIPKNEWMNFNHRLVQYGRDYCPARIHNCREHPLTKIFPKANHVWPKAH
jgi:endonuclease III